MKWGNIVVRCLTFTTNREAIMVNELPSNAEPLTDERYFSHQSIETTYGCQFSLFIKGEQNIKSFIVCEAVPPQQQPSAWNYGYMERQPHLYSWRIQMKMPPSSLGERSALALCEVIAKAVAYINEKNEAMKEPIERARVAYEEREKREEERRAQREVEMREWRERMEKEREQRRIAAEERAKLEEERAKKLYEIVRWLLDTKFRLKRDGHKSTVFGTIKRVSEPMERMNRETGETYLTYRGVHMSTVSEKNIPMSIALRDINWIEIKYEGERKYTEIYNQTKKQETTA